jgi:hypothetical protein
MLSLQAARKLAEEIRTLAADMMNDEPKSDNAKDRGGL